MAFTWRKVRLGTVRVFARMLVGVAISVVVVITYVAIDYMGATDKRLYFIDYGDAIATLLVVAVLIGGVVGMVWAFSGKKSSKE
jgi:hypothetical protein